MTVTMTGKTRYMPPPLSTAKYLPLIYQENFHLYNLQVVYQQCKVEALAQLNIMFLTLHSFCSEVAGIGKSGCTQIQLYLMSMSKKYQDFKGAVQTRYSQIVRKLLKAKIKHFYFDKKDVVDFFKSFQTDHLKVLRSLKKFEVVQIYAQSRSTLYFFRVWNF